MKQISREEWFNSSPCRFYCIQLCQLPFSVQELENIFNLAFFEYIEDGLGLCYGAYMTIKNKMYFLTGVNSKMDKEFCILVQVKSSETNLLALLDNLCIEFKVNKDALIWVNPDL